MNSDLLVPTDCTVWPKNIRKLKILNKHSASISERVQTWHDLDFKKIPVESLFKIDPNPNKKNL